MKKYFISFITLIAFFSGFEANAQCCGAGNPISISGTDNNIKKKHMQISLDYRHSYSDTYYEGSRKYEDSFYGQLSDASYDFLNLGIAYGITKRWTVQTQLGYYIDKQENFKDPSLPDARVNGIGDLSLSTSYIAYTNPQKGIELAPFVAVKFPIGKFDCENKGVKLPISMQPSSGSYKYSAGFYFYSNLSRRWYVTSYNLFEYAQRIVSKNFNYKYGNLTYLNAAAYFKALDFMTFGANLSYEYMSRSKDEYGFLDGTSYQLMKIAPQILIRPVKQFHMVVSAEIPLWRDVSGIQMSNKWAMQIKLIYDINFYNI
jgi:hypothetical protein